MVEKCWVKTQPALLINTVSDEVIQNIIYKNAIYFYLYSTLFMEKIFSLDNFPLGLQ